MCRIQPLKIRLNLLRTHAGQIDDIADQGAQIANAQFAARQEPALLFRHIAGETVQDDVQIVFYRRQRGPQLMRNNGYKLRQSGGSTLVAHLDPFSDQAHQFVADPGILLHQLSQPRTVEHDQLRRFQTNRGGAIDVGRKQRGPTSRPAGCYIPHRRRARPGTSTQLEPLFQRKLALYYDKQPLGWLTFDGHPLPFLAVHFVTKLGDRLQFLVVKSLKKIVLPQYLNRDGHFADLPSQLAPM